MEFSPHCVEAVEVVEVCVEGIVSSKKIDFVPHDGCSVVGSVVNAMTNFYSCPLFFFFIFVAKSDIFFVRTFQAKLKLRTDEYHSIENQRDSSRVFCHQILKKEAKKSEI